MADQPSILFTAKPKNFDAQLSNKNEVVNSTQNVDELIANNKKIDIPFLYKTYASFHQYEKVSKYEKGEAEAFTNEDVANGNFQKDLKFIAHRYYLSLKEHIEAGDFTKQQLRAYLLVREYVIYNLSINHSFQVLGKVLTTTNTLEDAQAILNLHDVYAAEQSQFFLPGSQVFSNQRQAQLKQSKSKLLVDTEDYYLRSEQPKEESFNQKRNFLYYLTENIRITNLVIDLSIAGTRDINATYHAKFNYKTNRENTLKTFDGQVYSTLPKINITLLSQQAGLSQNLLNDAAKVAAIVAQDNVTYAASANHFSAVAPETAESEFFNRYYAMFYNPRKGDEHNLSLDVFSIVKLYVEELLGATA